MMFQGSEHQDSEYFGPIQDVGGTLNGSTNEDRTNYWEIVPANHLERALLLEADRMGWLLPAMTQEKLANQQDVVRNERRQSEGQPYAKFWLTFNELAYPKGHPYDHSVIGLHEDLENATLEDVKDFFRTFYVPNNATLSIAGDIDVAQTKAWVEQYFGPIPPGEPVDEIATWIPEFHGEKRVKMQDRVQLTRLYWSWHTPPYYQDGDADLSLATAILGGGDTSRLQRRLVDDEKLAQDVRMDQSSQQISSVATLTITLRPEADPAAVESIVQEEIAKFAKTGPTAKELEQAKSRYEANFVKGIQRIGSWGGINDRLNRYNHYVGTPDYFRQDWERYASRTRETIRTQFARWIGPDRLFVAIEPFPKMVADQDGAVDRGTLPAGGPAPQFRTPDVAWRSLDSGTRVAVLERNELPLVSLQLVFRSGSTADPAGEDGVAGFAADMHLEGTRRLDRVAFRQALDNLGTDLRVRSDADHVVFSLTSLADRLDQSLDLLSDAILEPAFPEDVFANERDRRLVDLKQQQDRPTSIMRRATPRLLFGEDHPYGRSREGTEATLTAMNVGELRDFSRENFVPGNATVVAVGAVDPDRFTETWNRHFAKWQGAASTPVVIPAATPPSGRTIWLIDKPGDSQSTIAVAQLGLARNDPQWEAAFLANRVLGGFFSSRLNLNLREDKGWTYGVRSTLLESAAPSAFTMGGRVQRDATAPALVEFLQELEGVAGAKPITAEELQFAKNSIVLSYPQDFETNAEIAAALADQVVYGLPADAFARYPQEISGTPLAKVNEFAQTFFHPEDVVIVIIGDLAKIESSIRELDLDASIRYADREGNPTGPEFSAR
ncbi:MAG: insulinase family protein [Gemmatimonadetes bacterium]|nr:insulinase family protein [Gemmatimonadota bacterium]